MTYVIAGQTISLDGFVADAAGSAEPLYPDLALLQGSPFMNALIDETGAVVMGRRSFEMPDDPDTLADNYEFQTPIFVMTHHPPAVTPKENERLTFTFVTEGVESAVAQAAAAAGDKAVTVVGGVDVLRQLLRAGLVDELRVDVMPVLLGAGRRFLDDPSLAHQPPVPRPPPVTPSPTRDHPPAAELAKRQAARAVRPPNPSRAQ